MILCPHCGTPLDLVVVGTTPTVVPPDPGTPPATLVLPAEVAGRSRLEVTLPWGPWTASSRKVSSGPLNDGNVLVARFTTGEAVAHDVRIAAADTGQTVMRNAALLRVRDGVVLARFAGSTITAWLSFYASSGGIFGTTGKTVVEPNTAYALLIWNSPGSVPSTMFVDLYV